LANNLKALQQHCIHWKNMENPQDALLHFSYIIVDLQSFGLFRDLYKPGKEY
jgi:hypothetical protein